MKDRYLESTGAWIAAAGTVMSAVSGTPLNLEEYKEEWDGACRGMSIVGNAFQALGNEIQSIGDEMFSLERLGKEVQATGNITVVYGIVSSDSDEQEDKLEITGNFLQATGAFLAAVDEFQHFPKIDKLEGIGNVLQAIGNTLQAISEIDDLKAERKPNEYLEATGSWVQAVGAVLTAVAATKAAEEQEEEKEEENQLMYPNLQHNYGEYKEE